MARKYQGFPRAGAFNSAGVSMNVHMDETEIKGLRDMGKVPDAAYNIIVGPITKYLATGSRNALKVLLAPGTRINGVSVGASGMAAENIFVGEFNPGPVSYTGHFVYEGAYTKANYFIRTGTPPDKSRSVPINKIKGWLITKGIRPVNITVGNPQLPRRSGASNRLQTVTEQAFAIAAGIRKRGTSVSHKPLYPGGQKRFDYVAFAVMKLKMIDHLYGTLRGMGFTNLHRMFNMYLKTGRYDRGSAYRGMTAPRK